MVVFECYENDNSYSGDDAEYEPDDPCGCRDFGLDRAVGVGLHLLLRIGLLFADSVRGRSTVVGDGGLNIVLLSSASRCAAFCSAQRILSAKRVRSRPIGDAGFLRGGLAERGVVVLLEVDSAADGVINSSSRLCLLIVLRLRCLLQGCLLTLATHGAQGK